MSLLYCLVFLLIFSDFVFILKNAKKYNVYKKDAWYTKWQYWALATLCLIFPVFIMAFVFLLQILCGLATKLKVAGSLYNSPYSWIICIIVPLVGWAIFVVMFIYVNVMSFIKSFE